MSRIVWFVAGAGAGVYGLAKARRAAEVFTPEGLADRLAGLSVGLHLLREEVRAGMDEKESELRGRLAGALDRQQAQQQLDRQQAQQQIEGGRAGHPTTTREGND